MMMTANPIVDRTPSRTSWLGAAFALVAAALVFGAGPAEAKNEFKDAFEDGLGRIVAQQVAAVGPAVLLPPVAVRTERYYAPPVPYPYEYRRHYGPRHYRKHHRHDYRKRDRHHYRHGHRHHHHARKHGHHRRKHHVHDRRCGHDVRSTTVTVIEHREDRRDRRSDRRPGRRARYDY